MTYSEHWCSSFTISNCSLIVLLKLFLSFKRTILIALKVWDNHISPIFLWIWRTKGGLHWIGNKISKRLDVSPDFHWQKSSLTMGRNSFCENRLGYLDVAIMKNLQNLHAILYYRFVTCKLGGHRLGYLDVAIAKNSRNSHAICHIFATMFCQWNGTD